MMAGYWPWLSGTIPGCSIGRHGTKRWRLEGKLQEHCLVCHPPAAGLPAVHSVSGNPLPATAFADHHHVAGHLSKARTTT